MKPRLSLDVESTLAATNWALLREYNHRHGTDYAVDDICTWDWVATEIDFDEFMSIVQEAWKEPESMPPLEAGLGITVAFLSTYFDIDIVTARTGVEDEMKQWLAMHEITEYDEFHSGDVDMNKAELGYDVYIDDKPHLADLISDEQTLFLRRHAYNEHIPGTRNIVPVDSVADEVKV